MLSATKNKTRLTLNNQSHQTMKVVFIIFLFISVNSFACINEYRTILSGEVKYKDVKSGKITSIEIDKTELREQAKKNLNLYNQTKEVEYLSDYGATLIYLSEYDKAKNVYYKIEKNNPDLYTTASNLGTLYELEGKPDSALYWIHKSIELNPKSHFSSEWIHVKILEYKVLNKEDYSESILHLDFGKDKVPHNPNNYELFKLRQEIYTQLRERLKFIKPENEIIGNIFFDYGNVVAQEVDVHAALESYQMAKKYGFKSKLMQKRMRYLKFLSLKAIPLQIFEMIYKNFLLFSILVFFSFIVLYRLRRRRSLNKMLKTN